MVENTHSPTFYLSAFAAVQQYTRQAFQEHRIERKKSKKKEVVELRNDKDI